MSLEDAVTEASRQPLEGLSATTLAHYVAATELADRGQADLCLFFVEQGSSGAGGKGHGTASVVTPKSMLIERFYRCVGVFRQGPWTASCFAL